MANLNDLRKRIAAAKRRKRSQKKEVSLTTTNISSPGSEA
jgi:hypothetical protein